MHAHVSEYAATAICRISRGTGSAMHSVPCAHATPRAS